MKCKHLLCLLLAYFAVTVASEAANGEHVMPQSFQENVTKDQNAFIQEEKNASSSSPSSRYVHESDLTERNHTVELPELNKGLNKDFNKKLNLHDQKHKELIQSESQRNDIAGKESRHFIHNLFHRYGNENILQKEHLTKLFVNIGLTSALNMFGLEKEFEKGYDDQHYDYETGHHDDHKSGHQHGHENTADAIHEDTHNHHHPHQPTTRPDVHPESEKQTDSRYTGMRGNSSDPKRDLTLQKPKSDVDTSPHLKGHNECLSAKDLLTKFGYNHSDSLTADEFRHLCPALIDQLDAGYCRKNFIRAASNGGSHHDHQHDHDHDHPHEGSRGHDGADHNHEHDHDKEEVHEDETIGSTPVKVWCYALVSVAAISLCSVAGVVVIPNMKRVFYNHVLQFLVALAVGAMSGDAMLHLLPHAMMADHEHAGHHHQSNSNETDPHHSHGDEEEGSNHPQHMTALYKGLVALLGIYSFFFLERLFTLFTRNRSGRSKRKQKRRRRCLGGDDTQRSQAFHMVNSNLENDGGNAPSCDEMVMVVHPNKALRAYADVSHEAYLHRCDESLVQSPSGHVAPVELPLRDQQFVREDSLTMEGITNTGAAAWSPQHRPIVKSDAEIVGVIKDAEPVQNSHSHSHSHSHLAPDFVGPLSSVAMMVVVGDMVHNLCDGLAIGAAFAGSIAGGLSTSVAVFCHELPHEIGDFAVLVRSGLTMKKAVYFNLMSSIPCFIGAVVGLAVGNVASTSSWIFAGVGGMFFYITLVDLVPEMSSVYTKCGEPWFLHLLLQASGISVGTTIMLIIAVSEETLMKAFV